MNLEQINTQTTWAEASKRINDNNARINEAVTRLQQSESKSKGYFGTPEILRNSIPSATMGSKAYVGTNFPYAIYVWNGSGWVDSGETLENNPEFLGDYYTKEEVNDRFAKIEVEADFVFDGGRADTLYGGARILDCGGADAFVNY